MLQITVIEQITERKEDQDFYVLSLLVKDEIQLMKESGIEVVDIEFKDVYGKMYGIIKYRTNN